jgi:hypothetical protein
VRLKTRTRAVLLEARMRGVTRRGVGELSARRVGADLLDQPLPAFSGDCDEMPDEATIRPRLRVLVDSGLLPQIFSNEIWASRCTTRHACTVCTSGIEVGEVEYELSVDGVVVFVHTRCFSLWRHHGKRTG